MKSAASSSPHLQGPRARRIRELQSAIAQLPPPSFASPPPYYYPAPLASFVILEQGVLSEELGSSALFLFLVVVLCVTFALLFAFRKQYLECVEITKRRKAAVASPADSSPGTTTSRTTNK